MKKIPAIKTVMTPFPYSVEQKANVEAALAIMDSHTIHHLPVTNDGELAGVISSRDIRRRQEHDADTALTVQDVMSSDTYTVDLSERLDSVLHRMAEHHLGSVIVTRKGKLAGIFTHVDACAAFAEFLREQVRRSGGHTAA
jgi:CBS domain-containing protein